MKIERSMNYSFLMGETKFEYKVDGTAENTLIALCLTSACVETFEKALKAKHKKTKEDKHNLACIKSTGYILRQFVADAVSDVKNVQNQPQIEVFKEEAVAEPKND